MPNKIADLVKTVNFYTKKLLQNLTDGNPVDQEEIDALNDLRVGAGMKPLNIAIPSSKAPEPEKKAPQPREDSRPYEPRPDAGRRKRPEPKTEDNTEFSPQAIAVNGQRFEGQMLPDNSQWTNRFYIKSESSGALYTIAQNKNRRYWGCDCPGWIGHRKCKHLRALGLPAGEQPFEAQLKAASAKSASPTIKFADDNYSPLAYVLAAEFVHNDAELASMIEGTPAADVYGEAHIDGPEAGPSNDEMNANQHEENGVPVTDGGIKSPERQNVNAIREAIETQAEMEVGKPIELKQEQVEHAVEQSEAKLNGEGAAEVSAKPGTQIVINVASKKKAGYPNDPSPDYAERVKKLEDEGLTTSDAQAVVDAEIMKEKKGAEPIGGEDDSKITSGHGGGMFGGTDLEGPSFHVGFVFRGCQREASFSSRKAAETFVKNASEKFGKIASGWTIKQAEIDMGQVESVQEKRDRAQALEPKKPVNSVTSMKHQKAMPGIPEGQVLVKGYHNPKGAFGGQELRYWKLMEQEAYDRLVKQVMRGKKGEAASNALYDACAQGATEVTPGTSSESIEKQFRTASKKTGTADPAKRNLVLEVLSHGPKTTGEIEKALGGGKYTNVAWPVLQELAKEGLLKHKQMRWSLKASVKTAEWKGWNEDMPVQVVDRRDYEVFPNLAAAKAKYPTLDPEHNTKDFTWAMAGSVDGKPAIRFETWPANKMYSASVKKARLGKLAFSVETRLNANQISPEIVANKLNAVFQDLRRKNPQGFMDSFEQQLPRFMMDIAEALQLQMDYTPENDTYMFYDMAGESEKAPDTDVTKDMEDIANRPPQRSLPKPADIKLPRESSLKSANIRVTSAKSMPQKGTPEWHQLQIAIQTMKMPDAITGVMGGPDREESEAILAQYGLRWDEQAYLGGASGVKKAGDGMAKTEEQLEKEAGFNFFFPGQVVKEFYPEIQHEIVDYPNATNQSMSGAGVPEIVGDGGHELEGMLDEALDTNIVEMIQLPADVGDVEPMAMAASKKAGLEWIGGKFDEEERAYARSLPETDVPCPQCGSPMREYSPKKMPSPRKEYICLKCESVFAEGGKFAADYSSTSPAGGMGIGRDGKPEVLEGAPLRKENDIRGYMFTDEFYGQYEGIPGAAMAVASKTAANGDEAKQFALFLKKVCGEIAATLVAAFKVTSRPLLDKVPGAGEIQLDIIEQGQSALPMGGQGGGGRVKWLMGNLNDGEIKAAINEAWAQAAVWNDNTDGGFVYEVFVRPETIDTDSLVMKYKFVCGTRE